MYAKLVSNSYTNSTYYSGYRIKDMLDVIKGDITESNKSNLVTFDSNLSSIVSTVPANWVSTYHSAGLPLFSIGANGTFIVENTSRKAGKKKYLSLFHAYTTTNITFYSAYNYTSGGVATNEANLGHVSWSLLLANLPVLYIKATPDCLLFYKPNTEIAGITERTTAAYDQATNESPCALFSINATDAYTVCDITNRYNPLAGTYTSVSDLSTRFKVYATTGMTPSVTRDDSDRLCAPIIPLVIDDLSSGWTGGSLSEYSGLYRTANSLGQMDDIIVINGSNYRMWPVGSYRYLVKEE